MLIQLLKEYVTISERYLDHLLHPHPDAKWQIGNRDILLLQGHNCYWNSLRKIGDNMSSIGYKIHVIDGLNMNTISTITGAQLVQKYLLEKNISSITIIAHSKGGLVAKYALDWLDDVSSKINKLISIATPFNGTIVSHLGGNVAELNKNSQLMKKLNSITKNNHKIISIRAKIDNLIIPNSSSVLEGAKNIKQDVIGHNNILIDQSTIDLIRKLVTS